MEPEYLPLVRNQKESSQSYGGLNDAKELVLQQPSNSPQAVDYEIEDQIPEKLKPFLMKPLGPGKLNIPDVVPAGYSGWLASMAICCSTPLIKENEIGLSWDLERPKLLGPGQHIWMSPFHKYQGKVPLTTSHITHGPIHIIRVEKGRLGYALDTDTGKPMLLVAGTHYVRKAEFKFVKFLDLNLPLNTLGALQLVRVDRGEVGYYFKQGELKILQPGLHVICPPDRFGNFISTRLELLDLPKKIHESADYVQLEIDADVLYSIVNPSRALMRVHDLPNLIRKTAISTLAGIIRSSNLSEVAGSKRVSFKRNSKDMKEELEDVVPSFQQKVHDEFLAELHDYMMKDLGVEICNIRINDLRIADGNLSSKISTQAVKIAEQEAEYRMLQKETDILTVRANNRAVKVRIESQAAAEQLLIQAKANADAKELSAKADKMSSIERSKAEAEGILLKAAAMRNARIMEGEGDKKYADMVGGSELGGALAKLTVEARALGGLNKVAYVPHLPSLLGGQGSTSAAAVQLNLDHKDITS